ncbi:MAG: 4-hydroxythreonine-4-phosphate dehydrogenase PdxA [Alphaproteobacteria bacterium]|nr:4-hydroxythreonine-4-phosphate dehydrogenase PdxA [Alphaproteobacteria bacterium]
MTSSRPLALTMGEPGGVGGELALKAWTTPGVPAFFLVGDADWLARIDPAAPVRRIERPDDAARIFPDALPVLPLSLTAPVEPGTADPEHAPAVIASIERAVAAVGSGAASAVVTLPIQKESLTSAGFAHPGHTEFLAELTGARRSVMMLVGEGLRAVPLTVHIPLSEVSGRLTGALIEETARIVADALRADFGIAAPRLVLAGLNPHAGEGGTLGAEDGAVMAPAAARLKREGVDMRGPLPADTLFHAEARARYDAVLCAYHDQALIPVKMLDFHNAVNVTLGLPIVRTSPDHGTALDIAGTGRARPDSLVAALKLAHAMAERRQGV